MVIIIFDLGDTELHVGSWRWSWGPSSGEEQHTGVGGETVRLVLWTRLAASRQDRRPSWLHSTSFARPSRDGDCGSGCRKEQVLSADVMLSKVSRRNVGT